MKDDKVYLKHILQAIERIRSYASANKETFVQDLKTQDAVIRQLEIIGEATKKVSEKSKKSRPEIPWRRIAGMRDKMIHDYFGVDLELVWEVIQKELDPLAEATKQLMKH